MHALADWIAKCSVSLLILTKQIVIVDLFDILVDLFVHLDRKIHLKSIHLRLLEKMDMQKPLEYLDRKIHFYSPSFVLTRKMLDH